MSRRVQKTLSSTAAFLTKKCANLFPLFHQLDFNFLANQQVKRSIVMWSLSYAQWIQTASLKATPKIVPKNPFLLHYYNSFQGQLKIKELLKIVNFVGKVFKKLAFLCSFLFSFSLGKNKSKVEIWHLTIKIGV